MLWNRLLTFIPDTVLQPVVSDATDVRAGEYATYLYIVAHCCEFKCSPGATFDYQHAELVVNDVDSCLPWGFDMSLGSVDFSINVTSFLFT